MKLESYTEPRPWLLARASVGKPLIVALCGYTQRVADPAETNWSWRQLNTNFVVESGLTELAEADLASVAFVSPSRRSWAPWWARNWNTKDMYDVDKVISLSFFNLAPNRVFVWGFSDGATLSHCFIRTIVNAVVAHSGLASYAVCIDFRSPPCLLVCGENEPHRAVRESQSELERKYRDVGVTCERLTVPGGHEWAKESNREMLAWCVEQG